MLTRPLFRYELKSKSYPGAFSALEGGLADDFEFGPFALKFEPLSKEATDPLPTKRSSAVNARRLPVLGPDAIMLIRFSCARLHSHGGIGVPSCHIPRCSLRAAACAS